MRTAQAVVAAARDRDDGTRGATLPVLRIYDPKFYPLNGNAVGPGMYRDQYLHNYTVTLDWQPTRSYETEIELEEQDIEQMIEAQNRYRRKRGEQEITEDEIRQNVAREEARRFTDDDPRL